MVCFLFGPSGRISSEALNTLTFSRLIIIHSIRFLQQKHKEMELRKRRAEAEALLRGYRMSSYPGSGGKGFGSPMSPLSRVSESLIDPDCQSVATTNTRRHTFHGGSPNIPRPDSSIRVLQAEFENETPHDNDANKYASPGNISVKSKKGMFESEEKKSDDDVSRRHTISSPLKVKKSLPETIWRDFISSGKFVSLIPVYIYLQSDSMRLTCLDCVIYFIY